MANSGSPGLKLFQLKKEYKDPALSWLMTHGGHSGHVFDGLELVIGLSASDAIEAEWTRMEKEKKSSRYPVNKENWQATEVVMEGYVIEVRKMDAN